MPDSRAFSPVSTTSTAYVFSRKARAIKLATFRSSSTRRIRIGLLQYHRTTLAPHQTAAPCYICLIPPCFPRSLVHFEDQNLGARSSVLWNRHEVAVQFRNQTRSSSDWPRRYFPNQLVVICINLLIYICAAVASGIDTLFGRIVSQV